jgi:ABC-type sugar transport system substrate-binding protein
MQFKHPPAAGLVPAMRLARAAGLPVLAQDRLSVPSDKGANAGGKVSAVVAGMLAGGPLRGGKTH